MSRRAFQPFNLSFLDLLSSALGAIIFLFIITPKGGAPAAATRQVAVYIDTAQQQVFGLLPDSLSSRQVGDTLLAVLVDYRRFPKETPRPREEPKPREVVQHRPAPTPDRAAATPPERPDRKDPEKPATPTPPEPAPAKPVETPPAVTPPPVYRGDAPSVPCLVSFEVKWADPADNIDLFVCKDGNCVYGGRKRDRLVGEWDSGKSRNRLFGNDLRTNQEAVRQFDQILPGEYLLYAHFKTSETNRESVTLQGLIYTKAPRGQERGADFTKTLTRTDDRVLIGKVVLREDGNFSFTKN